jgi:hypothetical protein
LKSTSTRRRSCPRTRTDTLTDFPQLREIFRNCALAALAFSTLFHIKPDGSGFREQHGKHNATSQTAAS